jgi:hypothetical protein
MSQRAQRTCGIAGDHRIVVSQRLPQRRLNRFCLRRQVNQGIGDVAPDGFPLVLQQVHHQWHGRGTDPPDDFKRRHMKVFMLGSEESPQQRQRTLRALDQGGFGGGANLRVIGQQPICPVIDDGGVSGKTRLRRRQR